MPELPEVETTVRDLRKHLVGRRIKNASVTWQRTVAHPEAREFERAIVGQRITAITRRGKFLVVHLDKKADEGLRGLKKAQEGKVPFSTSLPSNPSAPSKAFLLIHLRMTGAFQFHRPHVPREKHVHVSLALDDGRELRFRDPRKFGRMWLVENPNEVVGELGPEPFEITGGEFAERIKQHRGRIKSLMLDQTFIAGVGNIYADESLWYARLHPLRTAESLKPREISALYRSIRHVLKKAIAAGGTSFDANYRRVNGLRGLYEEDLRVVGRQGERCYRCGTRIVKTVVGQRGTYYCPRCQRA